MSVITACDFPGTRFNSFVKDLPGGGQDQMNYLLFANYLGALCTLDQREKPEPDLRSHAESNQTQFCSSLSAGRKAFLDPKGVQKSTGSWRTSLLTRNSSKQGKEGLSAPVLICHSHPWDSKQVNWHGAVFSIFPLSCLFFPTQAGWAPYIVHTSFFILHNDVTGLIIHNGG